MVARLIGLTSIKQKNTKLDRHYERVNSILFSNDTLSHINIYYSEPSQLFLFCWLLTAITVSGTNPYNVLPPRPCCNINQLNEFEAESMANLIK